MENKDIVWIDIHGNKFYDFSQIEDRYLKNIAFGLANRKGNVKFLYNNKKAIDNIFAECRKRNIFYNNYDEKLKTDAYKIWLEENEVINKIFDNVINEAIQSAKEELGIEYD